MKEKKSKKLALNILALGLLGLLAFGIFGLPELRDEAAWERGVAEERLLESFQKLRTLRLQDDWDEIYDTLIDPKQREIVPKLNFLAFYGQGVLTVLEFDLVGAEIDEENRTAKTLAKTVAELNVARLPAKFRQGFQAPSDEELTRPTEHTVQWVWRDGSWYFQMEPEVFRNLEVAKGF